MSIPFQQLSFPEMYEGSLVGPLFRPFAEQLIETMKIAAGERVLDVACGTGIVSRLAKQRAGTSGKVVGVDLSPPMLAVAKRQSPDVEFREGNALALPLREGELFDVVLCQQGLQFFPDRLAAAREMHRALAADGRVGVTTWRPDVEAPVLLELRRVAELHVGAVDDRRHSFGDPAAVETLLRDAGFRKVQSQTVSRTIRFPDGHVFARLNAMAMVGMSAKGKDLSDDRRAAVVDAIVSDSTRLVHAHTTAAGFTYEIGAVLVTAAR